MGRRRVRWGWVGALAMLVVTSAALGVWLGVGFKAPFSGLLVSFSAGLFLLMAGFLLEPNLSRIVDRSVTEAVEQRMAGLEQLEALQAEQRAEFRATPTRLASRLRAAPDLEAVVETLQFADQLGLFDPHFFRVRATDVAEGPELYLHVHEHESGPQLLIDFGSVFLGSRAPSEWHPFDDPLDASPSGLSWSPAMSVSELLDKLESRWRRLNVVAGGQFSFAHALEMLAFSLESAFAARWPDPAGAPRLDGTLVVLVNDEWAVSTRGLCSLDGEHRFGFRELPSAGSECPTGCDEQLWDDAVAYVGHHDYFGWLMEGRWLGEARRRTP